jgi:hypothetical protein
MARRTVFWHIGPADPGTTFLAEALQQQRDGLTVRGIALPRGRWHEIEDQVWKHKGTSLLSTPEISRADQEKVALRLNGLFGVEVHLVVLVRDLPTQVYAGWQAGLQHGSTTSLTKYAERVLDPDRSHWQAEEFWAGRDLAEVLPRWTRAMHADRLHVVAAPTDPDDLWTSFLRVAGIADLTRPAGLEAPALTADLEGERVLDITTGWAKLIADKGYDMQGSLIAASATAAVGADRAEQFEAVTELLTATTAEVERLTIEVGRLREENARLDRKRRKHKRRLAALTAGGAKTP